MPLRLNVALPPGTLDRAVAEGRAVLRLRQELSVPEGIALVRDALPPTEEGRGWALYVPGGATVPCRAAVAIRVAGQLVAPRELLALNFAWKTGAGRVLLRCAASATPDGRRDALFPVDFYEEQLDSVAGFGGVPFRFPGWQLVNQDLLRTDGEGA